MSAMADSRIQRSNVPIPPGSIVDVDLDMQHTSKYVDALKEVQTLAEGDLLWVRLECDAVYRIQTANDLKHLMTMMLLFRLDNPKKPLPHVGVLVNTTGRYTVTTIEGGQSENHGQ